jgi:hypothetical protein
MVLDVFTPEECLQIVQAAEAIGFEKDEAVQGSATQKTSVSITWVWIRRRVDGRSLRGTLCG